MFYCLLVSFKLAFGFVVLIQVDIGGHPSFPTGSTQLYGNFGNLLFLVVFSGRGLPEAF
jgi:hypothetical protein